MAKKPKQISQELTNQLPSCHLAVTSAVHVVVLYKCFQDKCFSDNRFEHLSKSLRGSRGMKTGGRTSERSVYVRYQDKRVAELCYDMDVLLRQYRQLGQTGTVPCVVCSLEVEASQSSTADVQAHLETYLCNRRTRRTGAMATRLPRGIRCCIPASTITCCQRVGSSDVHVAQRGLIASPGVSAMTSCLLVVDGNI